jgi:hypothetical protein
MNLDPEDVLRVERIVRAFERSRFTRLELDWAGGSLRLSKAGPGKEIEANGGGGTVVVPAPRVGLFRAAPNGPVAGRFVARGAEMGFVDMLGEIFRVVAPHDGIVAECCSADGQFVEWGAPLFRLTVQPGDPSS